jgi:hypothetical protein
MINHLEASPLSSRLDRDKLMMLSTDTAASKALLVLDHMHTMKPHEALAAVAVVFATFAERTAMDPEELYQFGMKVLKQGNRPFHRNTNAVLDALADFAKFKLRVNPMISHL